MCTTEFITHDKGFNTILICMYIYIICIYAHDEPHFHMVVLATTLAHFYAKKQQQVAAC